MTENRPLWVVGDRKGNELARELAFARRVKALFEAEGPHNRAGGVAGEYGRFYVRLCRGIELMERWLASVARAEEDRGDIEHARSGGPPPALSVMAAEDAADGAPDVPHVQAPPE